MTDEQRLTHLKQRVDSLKADKIRAQERLDNALAQLKETYGFESVDEAKEAFNRTKKEIPMLETKLNKLLDQAESLLDQIENQDG